MNLLLHLSLHFVRHYFKSKSWNGFIIIVMFMLVVFTILFLVLFVHRIWNCTTKDPVIANW